MHASRYNVIVGGDGETLLYNTASEALASLDDEAFSIYEHFASAEAATDEPNATASGPNAAAGELNAAAFPAAIPSRSCAVDAGGGIARMLAEAGFLTDASPSQELENLRWRFERARADLSNLTLVLVPTYACNYRCPYCYEQGVPAVPGVMEEDVMDAVMRFIEARHTAFPFSSLTVQWYGGDPSLALPQVEALSEKMIAYCDEHGASYDAMILTNGNLINDEVAEMLARCRVHAAMLTIDGFEQTHNKRRVPAENVNSYERVINAATLFIQHGILVNAIMNVDRVNWKEYRPLRDHLRKTLGIELSCSRLSDCGRFYGTRDFRKPEFDLFSPGEFARMEHDQFAEDGFDAQAIRAKLAAPPTFCNGQHDNNYLIDCKGDVYACDGYVGHKEHVVFNLLADSDPAAEKLSTISHDPFESAQCSACRLLPICLGNCNWERETEMMQCHPLRFTLPDYLRDLRSCYPKQTQGLTLLQNIG